MHGRVLPDDDLIQGVAVSAHDLVDVLREHKVAHLGARVDAANWLKSVRVPEPDASVSCAAS